MTFEIIESTNADILARLNEGVQRLHHDIEPNLFKPYDYHQMKILFTEILKSEDNHAYIIMVKHEPVGYMILNIKRHSESILKYAYDVLHIDQLSIESPFQGRGLGKALVEFAKDLAKNHEIQRIEMNYWSKNINSGYFFRRLGFENYNERLALCL